MVDDKNAWASVSVTRVNMNIRGYDCKSVNENY